ncbi:CheB methylesterase [Flammeovirgaceae bacterium 311]|nr:CheB methylesterase [Flammeovirgaceae bacterium 311]
MEHEIKLIVMGGSWGGIQASLTILKHLPDDYSIPIILVLHRLRNFESELHGIYSRKIALKVKEVDEKEFIRGGYVYIAPANYHVLIEKEGSFSLDCSELENYSRPSIDVTFTSAALAFGKNVAGILLSGASKDGSMGLKSIVDNGGIAVVQHPEEAEVATMPLSAIQLVPQCRICDLNSIQNFLFSLQ